MNLYTTAVLTIKEGYKTPVLKTLRKIVIQTQKEEACDSYVLHDGIDNEH